MTPFIKLFITIILFPGSAFAQDQIRVDLGADWLRRDWAKCNEKVSALYENNAFTIRSDHAAALFWQIPTRDGQALPIDRDQSWVKKCDRPPMGFEKEIQKGNTDRLVSIQQYPFISWQWRIANTIDDQETANEKGEIQQDGDDFAAKIGISLLTVKGELREIAYLWTRTFPEESTLTQVTTVIPWVLKFKWYRIVAQSGDQYLNTWVTEKRSLYEDFKRFYPKEEPREIVRVYLMSDSDNTGGTTSGAFSNLIFHKNPPLGYVNSQ
jgi:hypothetical protein